MADEIKVTHKAITIAGRKLVISKATFGAQLKRFTLMENAEKQLTGDQPQEESLEALIRRGFTIRTYPSLTACTTGKVFSEAECFEIENDDLELWLATARELNPTWFPSPEPEPEALAGEVIEKKS